VHDALGDALVVEVKDLLAHHEIFEELRPAFARGERVLVVGDGHARAGGHRLDAVSGELARLPARPAMQLLVAEADGVERVSAPGRRFR
jgi:hypothetical protein